MIDGLGLEDYSRIKTPNKKPGRKMFPPGFRN